MSTKGRRSLGFRIGVVTVVVALTSVLVAALVTVAVYFLGKNFIFPN